MDYRILNKVSVGLGIELEPARLKAQPGSTPEPARVCPVELRGEGLPIRVYGRDLGIIKGVAYKILSLLIDAHLSGGGLTPEDIAKATESAYSMRLLRDAIERPSFELLRRVIPDYNGSKGKIIAIIDLSPASL